MNHTFYVSTNKAQLNLDVVCNFLSKRSYWATGRSRETIEQSIENSLCFGLYDAAHKQVGFARVVSDHAVFAWLLDVFILEDYRGKGLGTLLMAEVMNHASLQGVKRWGLGTRDAHGLYKKFGFQPLSKPEMMMERVV